MTDRSLRARGAGHNAQGQHSHPSRPSHRQIFPSSVPPRQSGHRRQMKSPSLDEKIAFFDQLDALDNVSDEDEDVDEEEQNHRAKCRAFFSAQRKPKQVPEPAPTQPRRPAFPTPAATATTPGPRIIEATPTARNPAVTRAAGVERLL